MSAATLRNYVRAWEVWSDLPEAVRAQLGLSHLVQLARVDPVTRSRLAFASTQGQWPLRQLEGAVDAWAEGLRSGKGGRPRLPLPVKAWGQVFAATRQARKLGKGLATLEARHRERLTRELEVAVAELQATLDALRVPAG